MKTNILWGVGIAGVLAVGLSAQQTQPQDQSKSTADDRKVTVQGCLERDYLYSPGTTATATAGTNMSPTPFKLTQIDVIKDEKASKDKDPVTGAMKDAGSAVATGAEKTADVVTFQDPKQSDKTKDLELHVASATTANVNLDSEVNHKVELVGLMSSNDVNAARGKAKGEMLKTPLMFKATSVKSIADKCQ